MWRVMAANSTVHIAVAFTMFVCNGERQLGPGAGGRDPGRLPATQPLAIVGVHLVSTNEPRSALRVARSPLRATNQGVSSLDGLNGSPLCRYPLPATRYALLPIPSLLVI